MDWRTWGRDRGLVVEGGRFDWEQNDRFPTLTEPYAPFGGIQWYQEFGPQAFVMRARSEGMRDFGPSMSPKTPSTCSRDWKPCRCVWTATWQTLKNFWNSCNPVRT